MPRKTESFSRSEREIMNIIFASGEATANRSLVA